MKSKLQTTQGRDEIYQQSEIKNGRFTNTVKQTTHAEHRYMNLKQTHDGGTANEQRQRTKRDNERTASERRWRANDEQTNSDDLKVFATRVLFQCSSLLLF